MLPILPNQNHNYNAGANNPEYFYLLGLSHRYRENRVFTNVVDNLRKAISLGQRKNWDVSDWEALLRDLTTGTVYIQDQD